MSRKKKRVKYSQNDAAGETCPTNDEDCLLEHETDEKSFESEENEVPSSVNNESAVNEGESYGSGEEEIECDIPEEEGDIDGQNEKEEGQEGSELNTENDTEEEGSEESKDDDNDDIDDASFL